MSLEVVVAWVLLAGIVWIAWRHILDRSFHMTAVSVFFWRSLLFAIGIFVAPQTGDAFYMSWLWYSNLGLGMFVLGAWASRSQTKPTMSFAEWRERPMFDDLRGHPMLVLFGVVAASVLVGLVFVVSVGPNNLLTGISGALAGDFDRLAIRESRATIAERAAIPVGYAAQFTAILLPTCLMVLWLRTKVNPKLGVRLVIIGLAAFDVYAMTASGSRKFLFETVAITLILFGKRTGPLPSAYRPTRMMWLLVGMAVLAVFVLSTAGQGRISIESPSSIASQTVDNVYNRVSGRLATTDVRAAELLADESPVWGREWVDTLKTLSPGTEDVQTLSSRLHEGIFGNPAGNLPLTVWSSAWYNFGALGIGAMGLALGWIFAAADRIAINGDRGIFRVVALMTISYRLSSIRDPFSFFLEGPFTLLLLVFLVNVFRQRAPASRSPERTATAGNVPANLIPPN